MPLTGHQWNIALPNSETSGFIISGNIEGFEPMATGPTAESQCPQVELFKLYKILWDIFIQMCANTPELRNFIVESVRRSGAVRAHCEQ